MSYVRVTSVESAIVVENGQMEFKRLALATAIALFFPLAIASGAHAVTLTDEVPKQLAGKYITALPTKKKVVALTFDAGANADAVKSILATLKREELPATFFLTGNWVAHYPKQTKQIAARGYVLGNHTYNHPYVTKLTYSSFAREVDRTNEIITKTAGRGSTPWFRFPYGAHYQSDVLDANRLGYVPIGWTEDAAGWLGTSGGMNVSKVTARVMKAIKPGAIILMHCGSNPKDHTTLDADALPGIIDRLQVMGYSFTTIDDLLNR